MNSSSLEETMKPQKTVVLIHGLWVTPSSWGKFQRHYESLGHQVIVPPWPGNRKNFRKYSAAVTEYKEFAGRSHYIVAEKGWEEVAQYALDWALARFPSQEDGIPTATVPHQSAASFKP